MKLEPIADAPRITLAPRDDKARRRSNTAPGQAIPLTAEDLAAGVPLETLLALPVPVLTYAGQVTIHGTLKASPRGTVSGYADLTLNGNGTLGVRWTAIDAQKKAALVECLRRARTVTPWRASTSSKGLTVSREVATVAEGREALASLPPGVYGSACLMRCVMSGTIYADVSIGAIAETSLWQVIHHFAPGFDNPAALDAARAEERHEQEQRDNERAMRQAVLMDELAQARETLRQQLASTAAPVMQWKPAIGSWRYVTPGSASFPPRVRVLTLTRRGACWCSPAPADGGKAKAYSPEYLQTITEAAAKGFLFNL